MPPARESHAAAGRNGNLRPVLVPATANYSPQSDLPAGRHGGQGCAQHQRERGLFITFEGPDGSGKSTQARLLAQRLRGEGRAVLESVEPGGTPIGQQIRRILLDPTNKELTPVAELLLMFAARAQNVEQWILPALHQGQIVISDRFTDSSIAYQGSGRGLGWG